MSENVKFERPQVKEKGSPIVKLFEKRGLLVPSCSGFLALVVLC